MSNTLRATLIRATYDWLVEQALTPYFLIDAEQSGVEVPREYVEDGKIILNGSPIAIRNFLLDDQCIAFEASFSAQVWQIYAPLLAIYAVYASETGQGIYARDFGSGLLINEGDEIESPALREGSEGPLLKETPGLAPSEEPTRSHSHLKVVK